MAAARTPAKRRSRPPSSCNVDRADLGIEIARQEVEYVLPERLQPLLALHPLGQPGLPACSQASVCWVRKSREVRNPAAMMSTNRIAGAARGDGQRQLTSPGARLQCAVDEQLRDPGPEIVPTTSRMRSMVILPRSVRIRSRASSGLPARCEIDGLLQLTQLLRARIAAACAQQLLSAAGCVAVRRRSSSHLARECRRARCCTARDNSRGPVNR